MKFVQHLRTEYCISPPFDDDRQACITGSKVHSFGYIYIAHWPPLTSTDLDLLPLSSSDPLWAPLTPTEPQWPPTGLCWPPCSTTEPQRPPIYFRCLHWVPLTPTVSHRVKMSPHWAWLTPSLHSRSSPSLTHSYSFLVTMTPICPLPYNLVHNIWNFTMF